MEISPLLQQLVGQLQRSPGLRGVAYLGTAAALMQTAGGWFDQDYSTADVMTHLSILPLGAAVTVVGLALERRSPAELLLTPQERRHLLQGVGTGDAIYLGVLTIMGPRAGPMCLAGAGRMRPSAMFCARGRCARSATWPSPGARSRSSEDSAMTSADHPTRLTIRLRCCDLPPAVHTGELTEFGLQDKRRQLDAGQPDADGARCFTIALAVQVRGTTDAPDFASAAVHGPPGGRFLYLGWRIVGTPGWIRRWKIPLGEISWEQIAVAQSGTPLTAEVSAAGGSTIRPLAGWQVG